MLVWSKAVTPALGQYSSTFSKQSVNHVVGSCSRSFSNTSILSNLRLAHAMTMVCSRFASQNKSALKSRKSSSGLFFGVSSPLGCSTSHTSTSSFSSIGHPSGLATTLERLEGKWCQLFSPNTVFTGSNVGSLLSRHTIASFAGGSAQHAFTTSEVSLSPQPTSTNAACMQKNTYTTSAGSNSTEDQHDSKQHNHSGQKKSEFPGISRPIVGYWYLFSGALVFGIVSVGGLTRLTESGLSIVEWNLIKGMYPPQSESEWEAEFEKYKQFPEFKIMNHRITLTEFKFIFFMEWAHRMLGRFIGLSFVLPGVYFAYKGYMTPSIKARSFIVATLIGLQGLLGWYMVKSGLSDTLLETPHTVPRVSHYWLCAHLGSAFAIYSIMFMTGMEILSANRMRALSYAQKAAQSLIPLQKFRKYATVTAGLVFLTALSGGLVAGLDAGLIHNEFPFMGNGLIPEEYWTLSTKSDRNVAPISWIRNMLENPSAVQFNHRVLGCTTATTVVALWIASRRIRLPKASLIAINALLGVAVMQVTLGITTLIYLVPIPLAAAHQSGSLTLLTVAMWLVHTLRVMPK
ncbi:hypothetical protein BDV3_002369 [Batrachochytrium dendrobatidis]